LVDKETREIEEKRNEERKKAFDAYWNTLTPQQQEQYLEDKRERERKDSESREAEREERERASQRQYNDHLLCLKYEAQEREKLAEQERQRQASDK
jgi:hypothetical protein